MILAGILFLEVYGEGQTQYFNSFDDTKIAFTDEGKGKAVLLIHGFLSTKNNSGLMNAFNGKTTEETQGAVDYAKSLNADLRSLWLQHKYQPVTRRSQLSQLKIKVLVVAVVADLDTGNLAELQKSIPEGKFKLVPGDHENTIRTVDFSDTVLSFL